MPAAAKKQTAISIAEAARATGLDRALGAIAKNFGEGALMRLGDGAACAAEAIPSGSLGLDLAIGIGGMPRGRIVEIFGPESSGKTTLALHTIAEAQKRGGVAAYIDAEHALDPARAEQLGVQLDALWVSQPSSGEEALQVVEMLVASGAVDVVVIDSVSALVPRAELEGSMGDAQVGGQARLMSQAMRKLTAVIARTRTCVIFINQIRMKIGVLFGSPETTSGGNALKFYASLRLNIRRIADVKEAGESVGGMVRVKVVKNRLAAPFGQAAFELLYRGGISAAGELVDLGVERGVIDKMGSWFSYGETRMGQGRERARAFLEENPDITAAIRRKIITAAASPELAERMIEQAAAAYTGTPSVCSA